MRTMRMKYFVSKSYFSSKTTNFDISRSPAVLENRDVRNTPTDLLSIATSAKVRTSSTGSSVVLDRLLSACLINADKYQRVQRLAGGLIRVQ